MPQPENRDYARSLFELSAAVAVVGMVSFFFVTVANSGGKTDSYLSALAAVVAFHGFYFRHAGEELGWPSAKARSRWERWSVLCAVAVLIFSILIGDAHAAA